MTNDRTCPECGKPLPQDSREEVCPTCALQGLLKFVTADFSVESSGSGIAQPSILDGQVATRFGDYDLQELLARGGMGVVYKAHQISLKRDVALKMIQAGVLATPAEVKRFHTEAEAIAQLHHPSIVAVYEIGEHEGQHYFSMEHVAGRTLAEIVRDGALPAMRAASYVKTIAAAMHYAHQHGILHRDLKPANVIIDSNDQPRITDFGLAKRFFRTTDGGAAFTELTLSGQVLGSPNYLPPEQADSKQGAVGPPSDVYALGAILYHLITGRPPFQAESLTTLLRQVIETDPVAPRSLNPSIPRDLETICLKCLAKEPRHRYGTAQALADDLGRFHNHEPVVARPVGAGEKARRWCRRQPVRAGLIAALASVLLLGIVGISWQWRRAERERRSAISSEQLALRQAYASDMNLAQRSLEEGSLGNVIELLEKYRPTGKGMDLRGWEWRYLWGRCRSDEQFTLVRCSNALGGVAFSMDGKFLAVREEGGNIELWDWGRRQRAGILTNQSWRLAMGFVPKQNLLASANLDSQGRPVVSFWDVTTRQIIRNLPQLTRVNSLAFSPDGEVLATFHMDPTVRIWEVASGKLLRSNPAAATINWDTRLPLFSPDGRTLALGETRSRIRLLRWQTGEEMLLSIGSEANGVSALAFSPDGSILAAGYGYGDGSIRLWDAVTGRAVGVLEGHRGWVSCLVFTPDGQILLSGSADQTIRAWSVAEKREVNRRQGHKGGIRGLALAPDAKSLVSCAADGSVRAWNLEPERSIASGAHLELPIQVGAFGALFTANSRRLFTASRAEPVTIWDTATGTEIERIPALGTNNQSVAMSPDERLLAVGGWDGSLKIWDLADRRLLKRFQAHTLPIWKVRFFDGGKSLVSGAMVPSQQVEFRRWDVGSWQERPFGAIRVDWAYDVAQSPNQRLLAVSHEQDEVLKPTSSGSHKALVSLWNSSGTTLDSTLMSGVGSALMSTFSPDGRFVAAAVDGAGRVWEVESHVQTAVLRAHANHITSVGFSPDGERVVTGSSVGGRLNEVARVWDAVVSRDLISLHGNGTWTAWAQFSPDGNTILTVSWIGVAELWRAPSWEEIEAEEKGTR